MKKADGPRAVCLFFKEGYCAAGDHCKYLHGNPTIPCKAYFSLEKPLSCKFGSACMYAHKKQEEKPRPEIMARGLQADWGAERELGGGTAAAAAAPTEVGAPSEDSFDGVDEVDGGDGFHHMNVIDSLWDHADGVPSDKADGAYFYGAVGTFSDGGGEAGGGDSQSLPRSSSWAAVARKNAEPVPFSGAAEDRREGLKTQQSQPRRQREVCVFFATGNCRYGARCMNIHSLDGGELDVRDIGSGERVLPEGEDEDADVPVLRECGICYAPRPEEGTYGVLNGCDCSFCLNCIRQWRTLHGKEVSGSSSQVRLCPLCRNESHFIVPSVVACRKGPRKDLLIQNYRASLKRIPCRYLYATGQAQGLCPHGSSCFYLHRPEDKTTVHHVLNANGEVEVRGQGQDLFSFVLNKLK